MALLVDIPGAAAELGGISSTTVRRLIAAGELPIIRLGRRVLIEESALVDWVKRTKQREANRDEFYVGAVSEASDGSTAA